MAELNPLLQEILTRITPPKITLIEKDWVWLNSALMKLPGYGTAIKRFALDNKFWTCSGADFAKAIIWDWSNQKPWVEESRDCITPDTPIWVRINGIEDLIEAGELLPVGANFCVPYGVDVWTREGFMPLEGIRSRFTKKPIVRLLGTSETKMTYDHKLVVNPTFHNDTKYIVAGKVEQEQIIKSSPILPSGDDDYDWGWVLGFFFAEGSASYTLQQPRYSYKNPWYKGGWSIRNTKKEYLDKCQIILQRHFQDFSFIIHNFASEAYPRKTNYTNSGKTIYHLQPKLHSANFEKRSGGERPRVLLSKHFRNVFYTRSGKKRVPLEILHGGDLTKKGFLDGVFDGDGSLFGGAQKKQYRGYITTATPIASTGLTYLVKSIGLRPHIIDQYKEKPYTNILYNSSPKHLGGSLSAKWKFLLPSTGPTKVLDIQTTNGEFVAGDVAVKNCDDFAFQFKANLAWFFGMTSIAFVADYSSKHAYNIVILDDGIPRVLEPQTDRWGLQGKDNYKLEDAIILI